jgi:TolB-like protein/Flp pilus assembly protein TadD/predicted Ser/Thr protein kinase
VGSPVGQRGGRRPNPDKQRLENLILALADDRDQDWVKAEKNAVDPAERSVIQQLGAIALIRNVLRSLEQDGVVPPAEPAGMAPPGRRASAQPVKDGAVPPELASWGPLDVRGRIGRGTFGTVYRAREKSLDRDVALKLLHKVPAGAEKTVEARLLARLNHPNVVRVFGVAKIGERIGFWMEFVRGRTLKEIQENLGPFSAQEAILFGLELCRALAAVHQAGLLHCDVKAQNVMREAGGRVVLMDFGAAVLMSVGARRGRSTAGTPCYLAPEVLQGGDATVQSDLYSLGVLLYYLVTGDYPVTGPTLQAVSDAHANRQRRLLRDVRADLPDAFVRAVEDATAVLPENRPESAGAMESLLARAAGRSESSATSRRHLALQRERSIAVLPFVDLSPGKSLDFFCTGIAEEIIDALARIPGLRVVACGSAFAFEGRLGDDRHVGSTLKVDTVLRGSVRISGGKVRVIPRLMDAVDGGQLWSQRFDRELGDVLVIQEEIARAAANALGVRLHQDRAGDIPFALAAGTRDVATYMMYLKGRHYWNQRSEASLMKSELYFKAAVERDSGYAEAYAGLAETYTTLALYGAATPDEIMPKAKAAADRAIELADTLSSPYATSGCIAAVYDWRWSDAERLYRRAIELNPDDPAAHHWYAINYLVPLQRFDEASNELRKAADADPFSMPIRVSVGLLRYFAHRFADAERELRDSLELDAGSGTARLFLGLTLVELKRHDEAIHELETAIQLAPSPEKTAALGYALARSGAVGKARRTLRALTTLAKARYVSPSLTAQVHTALGETVPALQALERASREHALDLAWLQVRPVFRDLHSKRRFKTVVAAMNQ